MLPRLNTSANSTSSYGGYNGIPRSCDIGDWAGGKANRPHLLSGVHIFVPFLMQLLKGKQTRDIACVVLFMFVDVDKTLQILPYHLVMFTCWIGFAELNDMSREALLQQNSSQLVMQLTKEF